MCDIMAHVHTILLRMLRNNVVHVRPQNGIGRSRTPLQQHRTFELSYSFPFTRNYTLIEFDHNLCKREPVFFRV